MDHRLRLGLFAFFNVALNGLNYSFHGLTGGQMSPQDYGLFSAWMAWTAVLMVAGVSLQMVEAKRVAQTGALAAPLPWRALGLLALGLSLLVGLAVALTPDPLGPRALIRGLLVEALLISHLALSLLRGRIQGRQRWGVLNANSYGEVLVKLGAAVVLLKTSPGVESGLAAVLLGHLAGLAHAAWHNRRPRAGLEAPAGAPEPSILGPWAAMAGTGLLMAGLGAVDMITVSGRFPSQAGAFAVAQKYGLLAGFLLGTVTTLALPALGRGGKTRRDLGRILRPLILVSGLLLAVLGASALTWFPATVPWIFGDSYAPAAALMPWACLAAGLLGVLQLLATVSTAGRGRGPWVTLGLSLAAVALGCQLLEEPAQILQIESVVYGTACVVLILVWYREVPHGDERR